MLVYFYDCVTCEILLEQRLGFVKMRGVNITREFTEFCIHKIPKQWMCKLSGSPGQICQLRLCPVSHVESGTSSLFQSSEFCLLLNIKAHFFIFVAQVPWIPWPNTILFAKILKRTQVICDFELHFVWLSVKNGK